MKFLKFRTAEKTSEIREIDIIYDTSGEKIEKIREKVEREETRSRGFEWSWKIGEQKVGFGGVIFKWLIMLASMIASKLM